MRKVSPLTPASRIQRIEGDLDSTVVTIRQRQSLGARSDERQRRSGSESLRNGDAGGRHEGQGVCVVDVFAALEQFWVVDDAAADTDAAIVVVVMAAAATLASVGAHASERPRTFVLLFAAKKMKPGYAWAILKSRYFALLAFTKILNSNCYYYYLKTKDNLPISIRK